MARQFGFGYLKPPIDGRNFKFLAQAMIPQINAVMGKPKPRKQMYNEGPILNQGQTPQCVGFSDKGFLNAAPIMSKPDAEPSGTTLYHWAQDNDEWAGNNYDGSSVIGGCKGMEKNGLINGWANFTTSDQIINWTNNGYGTVIIGTYWYPEMDNVDKNGQIQEPGAMSSPIGGHAYRINWWDPKKQMFLIVNSWNKQWGYQLKNGDLAGMAYARRELIDRIVFKEEGECVGPTQVRLKPVVVGVGA